MADLTRRWLALVALTTLVIPQPAFAESVLEKTLDGVTDSLAAAAKLTAGVVLRVAALQPAAFQPSERPKVASQLADFDDALTQMAMAQRIVMGDVGDYVTSVRANGFKENEPPRMWRSIVTDLRELSAKVDIVRERQQNTPWLADALSSADEQAFGDALAARKLLLEKLTSLPAPRTKVEIDKLSALHARYLELIKQLADLRAALAEARRRFV